jgi:hypothetical protein
VVRQGVLGQEGQEGQEGLEGQERQEGPARSALPQQVLEHARPAGLNPFHRRVTARKPFAIDDGAKYVGDMLTPPVPALFVFVALGRRGPRVRSGQWFQARTIANLRQRRQKIVLGARGRIERFAKIVQRQRLFRSASVTCAWPRTRPVSAARQCLLAFALEPVR